MRRIKRLPSASVVLKLLVSFTPLILLDQTVSSSELAFRQTERLRGTSNEQLATLAGSAALDTTVSDNSQQRSQTRIHLPLRADKRLFSDAAAAGSQPADSAAFVRTTVRVVTTRPVRGHGGLGNKWKQPATTTTRPVYDQIPRPLLFTEVD